jgi:medium-chain acyl-[acyl-carrier-protein] hydrolase
MNMPQHPERGPISPATNPGLWLPVPRPRPGAALRLIGFPYAGGGVPVFRAWPDLLPETIELRVVQLPGRGPRLREECFRRISPAVDALEQVLLPVLDRPFAFFGHSLGAVLAFEVARRMCGRGLVPVHLFVSGNIAPQLPNPTPPIHQLSDHVFLEKVMTLNGMPRAVLDSQELLDIMLPVVRSDFTLLETYQHHGASPSVSCPITVFGGDQDPRTTKEGLEAWRAQTSGSFDVRMLPGDHFFIDTARSDLLAAIVERLAATDIMGSAGKVAR